MEDSPVISETLILESDSNPLSTRNQGSPESPGAFSAESEPTELLRALEVVERDSVAIAESFTSLFTSLRLALSEVTSSSVDHMQCFNEAAGRLQELGIEACSDWELDFSVRLTPYGDRFKSGIRPRKEND